MQRGARTGLGITGDSSQTPMPSAEWSLGVYSRARQEEALGSPV